MSKYYTFRPKREDFRSDEDYKQYRQYAKCLVCQKILEVGDEWRFQELQTPEEAGSRNVMAGLVHRKCVETRSNNE